MHPVDIAPDSLESSAVEGNPNRLEPMLVRLPPALAAELRNLARKTRVRQSDYLREAVADLLAKYGHLPDQRSAM
ncbi:ribbon-helix-helix domain-containing protein [Anaeromyxobacter dehalogenans]|uniref:CopG-like DNA-binding protein n=1 Tax=Anaeromyxobacter dehalogenans (strain 2CP-C) TaxID=290397 RepID=Q2II40_ANADE|nr:ribbon-helix-helix domain-containing protein [Anaeromyxobacter dehalogenans]ABC81316.1 CopG-like DNA-binding protein [Anaeromyxobacter dehalogenans 2CP-C]